MAIFSYKQHFLKALLTFWYATSPWLRCLYPLTLPYLMVCKLRRILLKRFGRKRWTVPVIVVGNVTVGGTGKTPLVIALAQSLTASGCRVGIVSRGYGANLPVPVYEVCAGDTAEKVSDEALLLWERTGCPVILSSSRPQAVNYLLERHACQVIISDDGLQHYAMGPAVEIAVLDGKRGVGNGLCIPFGPLREPAKRLNEVDMVVVNGAPSQHVQAMLDALAVPVCQMDLEPGQLLSLTDGHTLSSAQLPQPIAAVAGIGFPDRFLETLKACGIDATLYPFPDHHLFKPSDLQLPEKTIFMTEKDAVKCRTFATDKMYYLPVNAKLPPQFWEALFSNHHLLEWRGYVNEKTHAMA